MSPSPSTLMFPHHSWPCIFLRRWFHGILPFEWLLSIWANIPKFLKEWEAPRVQLLREVVEAIWMPIDLYNWSAVCSQCTSQCFIHPRWVAINSPMPEGCMVWLPWTTSPNQAPGIRYTRQPQLHPTVQPPRYRFTRTGGTTYSPLFGIVEVVLVCILPIYGI